MSDAAERVQEFVDIWRSRRQAGNEIYGLGTNEGILQLTVKDLRELLAENKALAARVDRLERAAELALNEEPNPG